MTFRPLSVRRGLREPFDFQPGIPTHIKVQLVEWVRPFFYDPYSGAIGGEIDTVIAALQWPIAVPDEGQRLRAVFAKIDDDDDAFLDLLDLLCTVARSDVLLRLDRILQLGMSEWRVRTQEPAGLEARLTNEARESYGIAVTTADNASEHVAEAWVKAFGRSPEPGAAWHAAVKAVESLLCPIVEPKNTRATLGSIVKALRAKPEKWSFELAAADGANTAVPFIGALEIIGYEPGRHGTDPNRATLEQARVVVLQAVTVVEWLRAGALKPV